MNKGVGQYKQIGIETEVMGATPHRLIQMLFEGAMAQLANAGVAIDNREPELLARSIQKTSDILVGLEEGLDLEKGGEIAQNLQALYQFMQTELLAVQVENSRECLDKLVAILADIKAGWDGIAPVQSAESSVE
jgi:flagellar protein FliS